MALVEINSGDQDELAMVAKRYCALLSAAMMLRPLHGTFFAACLLVENNVEIEHAVMVLALH